MQSNVYGNVYEYIGRLSYMFNRLILLASKRVFKKLYVACLFVSITGANYGNS